VITENNASLYQYRSHPDLNNQFQTNKKQNNDLHIPSSKQWSSLVENRIQDNHVKDIDSSLYYSNEHDAKIQMQESRLQALETKMKRLLLQQEACSDMLLRFNEIDLQLKRSKNENEELRKSLDRLQKKMVDQEGATLHRTRRNIDDGSKDVPIIVDNDMPEERMQSSINAMPMADETKMVAFDAYRDKPFHEDQKYITFDGMKVNVGGGFDPDSGMFKAPVGGIYSFSFHGLTQDGTATYVKLVHRKAEEEKWENVAGTYRRHEKEDEEQQSPTSNHILKNAEGMLALSVLLELGEGDEVAVFSYHGNLRDGGWHYTHFTGYLLR